MDIVSIYFILISLISVFVYYLINPKYRIIYLSILSCGYIATFDISILVYVVMYSVVNYVIGLNIPDSQFKKALFRTGIIINLSQLIVLKYASFAIDPVFQMFHSSVHISQLSEIIIPIGISYFTLQGIGYLINVKMGWEEPEKKFPNFLLYIIFYPKFLSGPIERSNHFLPQLKLSRTFNDSSLTEGLRIVLLGLFKKIVIANQLGFFVNNVYSDLNSFSGLYLWTIILIQPLYLYFDFSGYTDIAIGLAKTYGIDLLPNFDRPFLSENMTVFWKRFHMSLSLWFGDYLFKQLSFKYRRWGKYASVFAVFVTFTLFGIWHGAGWNFMLLGFIQALALNYEFFTKKQRVRIFSKVPEVWRRWSGRAVTYFFFGVSLIFFFSPDTMTAFRFYSKLSDIDVHERQYMGVSFQILLLALLFSAIFIIYEILCNDYKANADMLNKRWNNNRALRMIVYYSAIVLLLYYYGGKQEFIYTQF